MEYFFFLSLPLLYQQVNHRTSTDATVGSMERVSLYEIPIKGFVQNYACIRFSFKWQTLEMVHFVSTYFNALCVCMCIGLFFCTGIMCVRVFCLNFEWLILFEHAFRIFTGIYLFSCHKSYGNASNIPFKCLLHIHWMCRKRKHKNEKCKRNETL